MPGIPAAIKGGGLLSWSLVGRFFGGGSELFFDHDSALERQRLRSLVELRCHIQKIGASEGGDGPEERRGSLLTIASVPLASRLIFIRRCYKCSVGFHRGLGGGRRRGEGAHPDVGI